LIKRDIFEQSLSYYNLYLRKPQMPTTLLEDLFTEYNAKIVATDAEIEGWNTLDPVALAARLMSDRLGVANTVTTSVGLFGYDLDAFLEECATLEVDGDCEVADYDAYTGWAVGVCWSGD
jgi:hypothetical protein